MVIIIIIIIIIIFNFYYPVIPFHMGPFMSEGNLESGGGPYTADF